MPTDPGANLAAAQELLATLSAGRSALLQLAGAHLPFDRVLALHRLFAIPEPTLGGWDGPAMMRERLARDVRPAPIDAPARPAPRVEARPESPAPRPRRAGPGEVTEPTPRPPRGRRHTDITPERPAEPAFVAPVIESPVVQAALAVENVAEVAPVEAPVVMEPAPVVTEAAPVATESVAAESPFAADTSAEEAPAFEVPLHLEDFDTPVRLDAPVPPPVEESASQASAEAPSTPEATLSDPDTLESGPLVVDAGDSVHFSGSGDSWGTRPQPTIEELLAAPTGPVDDDHTLVAAAPTIVPAPAVSVPSELSEWAADVLGAPAEPVVAAAVSVPPPELPTEDVVIAPAESTSEFLPEAAITPLAAEPTSGELAAPKVVLPSLQDAEGEDSRPMLREPRVMGASVATLDVRAAARGVAPRLAGAEDIEVAADGEGDDNVNGLDASDQDDGPGGFQVTFEQSVAVRTRPRAPRLTDDEDSAEQTNPAILNPTAAPSIVIDDKRVQSLMEEAAAFAKKGELAKSIQAYTDALDMRPTLTEAHIGRGRCHLELGDYSSAMSDFARAEDLAPDKPEAHVATGDLYFARKEYKRAIEFYDQAVEIDGSHAMARCRRGISHYYRKNYRQAYQDLQRALALDPEIANIKKYVQMAQKKLERGE